MTPQGLLSDEQQRRFRNRGILAAISDGMMAYGGITPFASQAVAGQRQELEQGLLAQQQAEEEQAHMSALWDQARGATPTQMPQPTRIPDSPMFARRAQPGEVADDRGLIAPQAQQAPQPTGGLLSQGMPTSTEMFNMSGLLAQNNMFDQAEQVRKQAEVLQQQELRQVSDSGLASYLNQGLISQERFNQLAAMPIDQRHDAIYGGTTLSPGQTRFDQLGRPIAQVATTAEQERAAGVAPGFSLGAGQMRFDAEGNLIAQAPTTAEQERAAGIAPAFTLGAGQTRFDAEGNPIAQVATTAQQDAAAGFMPGQAEATARQRNIEYDENRLRSLYPNYSDSLIFALARGEVDHTTEGNITTFVNRDSGETWIVEGQFTPPPLPSFEGAFQSDTLGNLFGSQWTGQQGVPEGAIPRTGVRAYAENAINSLLGAVGAPEYFPGTSEFTNYMKRLQTDTVLNLTSQWAGRPSNLVLEKYESLTFDPTKIWQGDQQAMRELRTFMSFIDRQISGLERDYRQPTQTPGERARIEGEMLTLVNLFSDYEASIRLFEAHSRLGSSPQIDRRASDSLTADRARQLEAYQRNWGN